MGLLDFLFDQGAARQPSTAAAGTGPLGYTDPAPTVAMAAGGAARPRGLLAGLLSTDEGRIGLGLLAAAGPTDRPMSFGQRLLGGLNDADEMKQRQQRTADDQAMRAMQIADLQAKQMMRQRQQEFLASIPSPQMQATQAVLSNGQGPTMSNAARMPPVDPSAQLLHGAMQAGLVDPIQYLGAIRKDNSPVKLGAGEMLLDPRTYKPLASNPKEDDPSDVRAYKFAQSQGYKGSFNDYQLGLKRAGATAITVDQRGDNAYSTAQGKEYSDLMAGINKAGFNAPTQLRKLERMTQLLEGVDGGKLAPLGLDVASAANGLGIKLDPRLGNKEAAQALARELAGGLRQPGTGPMTDKDFDNFLMQIPDLSKTAAGRKQITATMQAALNRDMKVSQMAREYERKYGRIDGGFLDQVSAFIAENPVVSAPAGWVVQR